MWFTITEEPKEIPADFSQTGTFRTKKAARKEGFRQHFKEGKSEDQYILKHTPNRWILYTK